MGDAPATAYVVGKDALKGAFLFFKTVHKAVDTGDIHSLHFS